jgi:phage host-nuclease inhibitor protein Gam
MKNGKKRTAHVVTAEQFEAALTAYTAADQREKAISEIMETEMNELADEHKDELMNLAQTKLMAYETARNYCVANKEALFRHRRSIGTLHGVAGFRLGTPRLKTVHGRSWEDVMKDLRELLPAYIRTHEEPAKDMLLADRNKEGVAPLLMQLGVEVVQDELFYIEAKKKAA